MLPEIDPEVLKNDQVQKWIYSIKPHCALKQSLQNLGFDKQQHNNIIEKSNSCQTTKNIYLNLKGLLALQQAFTQNEVKIL